MYIKQLQYALLAVSVTAMFSCVKQLNQIPVSSLTTANAYSTANDFQQAVTGVYNKLQTYPDYALWLGELRSDDVASVSDGNRDWQGINDFSPNLTNTGYVVNAWSDMFNGIMNANTVIDALNTKGDKIGSDSLRTRYTAECRFLRAFYYFEMVRLYGEVPLIYKVMSAQEVATVKQSPVSDIYDSIISDLQFAVTNLPQSYTQTDYGRPTTYAAEGILGLVYMTRSGPTYDINGPGLNSNEWDKALVFFNNIIAGGQYQLLSSFPNIFSYTNENNKEVIFDVQFMSVTNPTDVPSELTPAGYWNALGLSAYNNGYGSADYDVPPDLLASYRNSAGAGTIDIRDTFSIQHSWATSATAQDTSDPFIKKYINLSKRGAKYNDWGINFIVLRYADILLMKAECILNGAAGSQTDVDAIVNQIRTRAGVPAVSGVDMPALMDERRREFLGEGLRWNDLVREGMAITTMNNWIAENNYTTIHQVVSNYVIYPVPESQILVKPGLYVQNPGYY